MFDKADQGKHLGEESRDIYYQLTMASSLSGSNNLAFSMSKANSISSKNTLGFRMIHLPRATLCFCPADKFLGKRPRRA